MPREIRNDEKAVGRWIGYALFSVVLAIYAKTTEFGFLNYDDAYYVYDNPYTQSGVTLEGLTWAFGNLFNTWVPLSYLSWMLDCQLYGLDAGGFHLTNLLFHAANSVLLFTLLRRLTGAVSLSALTALIWAIHPQHVESVAWISERKDVLFLFFQLLAMLAYVRYATGTTSRRSEYGLALVWFFLALLAKSMAMTLPLVLLLLDYWPLQRLELGWRRLLGEKLPFLLIGGVVAWITWQSVTLPTSPFMNSPWTVIPFRARLGNGAMAYASYLAKAFRPEGLTVFYPFPSFISWPDFLGSAALLLGVSGLVWWYRSRWPFALVGWGWFLGGLAPVIWLGEQALADRFTYWPHIGLFFSMVWSGDRLIRWIAASPLLRARLATLGAPEAGDSVPYPAGDRDGPQTPAMVLGLLYLVWLGWTTWQYQEVWRDSQALWSHALRLDPWNYRALIGQSMVLENQGKVAAAYEMMRQYGARFQDPSHSGTMRQGWLLIRLNRPEEAKALFERILAQEPNNHTARFSLGAIAYRSGKLDQARRLLSPEGREAQPDAAYLEIFSQMIFGSTGYVGESLLQILLDLQPEARPRRCQAAYAFLDFKKGSRRTAPPADGPTEGSIERTRRIVDHLCSEVGS